MKQRFMFIRTLFDQDKFDILDLQTNETKFRDLDERLAEQTTKQLNEEEDLKHPKINTN